MKKQTSTPFKSDVPIFILAGGLGTRISEETEFKPKPMVEIGETPILVHIMRSYYARGFNNFVICAGYKSFAIKQYFLNYRYYSNNIDVDLRIDGDEHCKILRGKKGEEHWRVRIIDTGIHTMTGARVARTFDLIAKDEPFEYFGLTYGDGLTDVDFSKEFDFHCKHGKTGTVLGVKNVARYGEIEVGQGTTVSGFYEKSESRQGYVSGGFFFFKKDFRKYLSTEEGLILEKKPLSELAAAGELHIFSHPGFWYCMDTLRDKNHLESLWKSSQCPWLIQDAPLFQTLENDSNLRVVA